MGDSVDSELLVLINKLNKIQKEVGGIKSKGNSSDHEGKIDHFLDLKNQMTERLMNLKETFENIQCLEKTPGSNPKELITEQSKVRSELAALNEEWKELESTYRNEAKKRRSKFSSEELTHRQQFLDTLQLEIQRIKDIQRAGYIKGYQGTQMDKMEDSELFNPTFKGNDGTGESKDSAHKNQRGVVGSRNLNMTDAHRVGLQQLKDRDAKIDIEIENIGKGVDDLHELSKMANEEVKLQSKMLDTLEAKIDDVHEHVTNVNEKLKTTLEEARKSDKICMDIVCLLILVGMIIVVYKTSTDKKS